MASASPRSPSPGGSSSPEPQVTDIWEGNGGTAKAGDTVQVHYVGVAYSTGEEFDASWDRGDPLEFQLGSRSRIAGWDQGVQRTQSAAAAHRLSPRTWPRLNSGGRRWGSRAESNFGATAQPGKQPCRNPAAAGACPPQRRQSDSDLDHYHDRTKRPQKRILQEARLCPSGRPGSGRFRSADNGPVTGRRAGQRRVPGQTHGRRPTGQRPRISALSAAVCIRPPPAGRRAGRDRCVYPPLTDLNPSVYAHGLSGAPKAVRTQVTSKCTASSPLP